MVINSSGDVSISLHANKLFGELLEDEAITEIAINRPREIFFEKKWCMVLPGSSSYHL